MLEDSFSRPLREWSTTPCSAQIEMAVDATRQSLHKVRERLARVKPRDSPDAEQFAPDEVTSELAIARAFYHRARSLIEAASRGPDITVGWESEAQALEHELEELIDQARSVGVPCLVL